MTRSTLNPMFGLLIVAAIVLLSIFLDRAIRNPWISLALYAAALLALLYWRRRWPFRRKDG